MSNLDAFKQSESKSARIALGLALARQPELIDDIDGGLAVGGTPATYQRPPASLSQTLLGVNPEVNHQDSTL